MQAATSHATLVDAILPPLSPDKYLSVRGISIPLRLVRDCTLIVGFAFFTALVAQIAIRIPETTVPITGQTFAVLLTGAALGSWRGAGSMVVYALLGMVLPVFAPPSGFLAEGTFHFILPWAGTEAFLWDLSSGGYIVGFILGAFLVGWLAERGWDRRAGVPVAMLAGNVMVYVVGLPWLAYWIEFDAGVGGFFDGKYPDSGLADKMLRGGLYPFIGGDAVKMMLAALAMPGAWWLVRRVQASRGRE